MGKENTPCVLINSSVRRWYQRRFRQLAHNEWVLHRCQSEGRCVNIEHIYIGSPSENSQDMLRSENNKVTGNTFVRGLKRTDSNKLAISITRIEQKIAVGEKNPNSKLTKEQVIAIRNSPEKSKWDWAKELNVSWRTIHKIRTYDSIWKGVV